MLTATMRRRRKPFLLSVAFGLVGCVATVVLTNSASAQGFSNVEASGTVVDDSGKPIADANIIVTSNSQGFTRETRTNRDGTFSIPELQPGTYSFTVEAAGYTSYTEKRIQLAIGAATNRFVLVSAADTGDTDILVSGRRVASADFDRTTTGLVIDVADLAQRVPIGRDLQSVIRLAPGANAGSGAFGGLTSISGGAVSENAYFVNGLNITNFRNYLSPVAIPFDFYQTIEVKTGGYAAEFGRTTGGFTNATTKSGSNELHGAVRFNWEPNDLRSITPETRGSVNRNSKFERSDMIAELGGPIIPDRLFFYGLYQARNVTSTSAGRQYFDDTDTYLGTSRTFTTDRSPFYGGRLDAIITDGHRVDVTYWNTKGTSRSQTFGNTQRPANRYDYIRNIDGPFSGSNIQRFGGENYTGRYTGVFADWLTLSAQYGRNENLGFFQSFNTSGLSLPPVTDARNPAGAVGLTLPGGSVNQSEDVRKQYRADASVRFDLFGSHHIRFGYDREELFSYQSTIGDGGGVSYRIIRALNNDPRQQATGTDYLRTRTYNVVGGFNSKNEAYYIQDSWMLAEGRVVINPGIRNDRFSNDNSAGTTFYKSGNQWGPRLGFIVDPIGEQTDKIFGSFSRLYIPVASNTNIRLTGGELYFDRYTQFNGLGANNVPIAGAPLVVSTLANCPDTGTRSCTIFSDGQPRDAGTQVAQGLKPQSVDEYQIGYEKRLGSWRFRAFYTQTKLNEVLEDIAIDAAVRNYCTAQKVSGCGDVWNGFHQYVLANPGQPARITLSDPINGESTSRTVDFTAAQLGYPRALRTHKSVTLEARRDFDGIWSLEGSYVYGRTIGNYEGGVKSDNGQSDTGLTQDFDQPGLTNGLYGPSPNNRDHVIKLFGSYRALPFLTIGFNTTVTSPRSFGCIGRVPASIDSFAGDYGASGAYCQVNPDGSINTDRNVTRPVALIQRGSVFKSDWLVQNDLDIQLIKDVGRGQAYLRASIFNVLNLRAKLNFNEFGTDGDGNASPLYRDVTQYQSARSVRLQAGVTF